jgi:hypothetical protein
MDYFVEKIEVIRGSTGQSPPTTTLPPSHVNMSIFSQYSEEEVRNIIASKPMKSCCLDPIPGHVLKEFLPELLPYLTAMCNKSLEEGSLPRSQRHAVVKPILKKDGLDVEDVRNYRPISNLTFASKLVERLVNLQLTDFLEQNGLLPRHQSGFRRRHSTETALLKVMS